MARKRKPKLNFAPLIDSIVREIPSEGINDSLTFDIIHQGRGCYLILFAPTPQEIIGGPHDGAVGFAPFLVDLGTISKLLTKCEAICFVSAGRFGPPHASIQGEYLDRPVELRFHSVPLSDDDKVKLDAMAPFMRKDFLEGEESC